MGPMFSPHFYKWGRDYGAFATPYFILYNNHVAGTITAQGRELTKTMDRVNEDYWYNQWHIDTELHNTLNINNITQISKSEKVSIYGDTDSIFVSFKPAIDHCNWKNLIFNRDYIDKITEKFIIISIDDKINFNIDNPNCVSIIKEHSLINIIDKLKEVIKEFDYDLILIDGYLVASWRLREMLEANDLKNIQWNWSAEEDFIHGIDYYRLTNYFKVKLDEHASKFGVENKQDFELERISESIINLSKKKYIQNIVFEDGIFYDKLSYIYPKGVELVRSSTPAFAREKIVAIVKYLFSNPDTFNIKELLKLVKNLRKEFELANIDDISSQSSVSNYNNKVLNDKTLPLQFVSGTHFAVKSAAHYNYLLMKNKSFQQKYEFIKSGNKIKYYVCKDVNITGMFAYIKGSFPIEFAPEICYDTQFQKSILSPINSIIEPLGLPEITKRLSVVLDIFSGF